MAILAILVACHVLHLVVVVSVNQLPVVARILVTHFVKEHRAEREQHVCNDIDSHWNISLFVFLRFDIPTIKFGVESCQVLAALDVGHAEQRQ